MFPMQPLPAPCPCGLILDTTGMDAFNAAYKQAKRRRGEGMAVDWITRTA